MKLLALTGGIGTGKSSASTRLGARGAIIVDADLIVRELQQPGTPVFAAMVQRWGDRIVAADGTLDRAAVAGIVFTNVEELAALEALVHPEVRREVTARVDALADSDAVVVQDVPLLDKVVGAGRNASAVIVVDCPVAVAVERLITHRGFSHDDVEARMAAQLTRDERLEMADFVIDNGGDLEQLDAEVARCWQWIATLPE